MAEVKIEILEINEIDSTLNEQIAEVKAYLLKNTCVQNPLQDDQNPNHVKVPGEIQQINENDSVIEQNILLIANNSLRMRLKVLAMELNVVRKFSFKAIIENERDSLKEIFPNVEKCMDAVYIADQSNNAEKAENYLLLAENLSTKMMKKIKKVVKNISEEKKKAEVKYHEDDTEVPDYRSIVTVRGTKDDVINCILKATTALENRKYDRAICLLLKAERICPTKNARDLLNKVQAAKKTYQNLERIEVATEAKEEEESIFEGDSISAAKCLTAFEKAFNTDDLEKAERMLNMAKRIDPSLDVREKLYLVNAEKTKRQCTTNYYLDETNESKNKYNDERVCDYIGNRKKEYKKYTDIATTFVAHGDLARAECFLLKAFRIYPKDDAKKLLKWIQDVRASQSSSDEATTSRTVKSDDDLKREEVAEQFTNLGINAMISNRFHVADHYLERAFKTLPNKLTRDLLQDVKRQINSLSESEIKFEANRLLSETKDCIHIDDLVNAESFLIISWGMNSSQNTRLVLKAFLEARLAHYCGTNDKDIENVLESDNLVLQALDMYENNTFEEAEKLLLKASNFYTCASTNQLLLEIRLAKLNAEKISNDVKTYF